MNYIYDITLNLNKNNLYNFYEWKDEDDIEFILKIPIFKIDEETFKNIKYNDIIIDKKVLEMIENKTETYSPNCIGIIRYACVFINDESAFAIEFDSEGNNYMKSLLSIDEENEIIDETKNIKYNLIDYKIRKKLKRENNFITRNENEIRKKLVRRIETMKENDDSSKLKYIFYEVYNEKIDDIDKIYNKLINLIRNNDYKVLKLNEIISSIDNRKIMSNNS